MHVSLELKSSYEDGFPFSSTTVTWDGLTREEVNYLEGLGINFLKSLNELGAKHTQETGKKDKK